MKLLFQNPAALSPTTLRLALLLARAASWIAPLLLLGFLGVALAHLLFEVGNYPTPRARHTVGALFLFLFCPATGAIWHLSLRRVRALRAHAPARREKS